MKRTPQQRVSEHNTLVRALDAVGAINTMSELPPHEPGAHRNLSGVQFRHYPGDSKGFAHKLIAKNSEGEHVGSLSWDGSSGRVHRVFVPHEYQGLGVATSLWERAHKLAEMGQAPAPKHSNDRTIAGDEWASKVGGKKPILNSGRGWSAEQRRKLFGK